MNRKEKIRRYMMVVLPMFLNETKLDSQVKEWAQEKIRIAQYAISKIQQKKNNLYSKFYIKFNIYIQFNIYI